MATNYPAGLDSYTPANTTDTLDAANHTARHTDIEDAVEAIEAELGTDPAGAEATVKARIAATETVANAAYTPGGTDVAVADGGTGASTAAAARTNLGVSIGSDVQAWSAVLDATTASFTTADETKLDGIEAAADVTDAANVAAAGAPIITSGAGSPSSTPAAVGDIYVDLTADTVWVAADTTGSGDWKQATGAGGGDLLAANNLSDVASASTSRTNLGLAIGTDVQAFDALLAAIAALTTAADQMIYATGSDTVAMTALTAFARTLLDDANAAAARATLDVDQAGTDNSTDVTLAGTPDYLTIAGQVITRNAIDLTADVTGTLPEANGGTGVTTGNATTSTRLDQFAAPTADLDINDNALDDVVYPVLTITGTTDTAALEDRNGINRCTDASAVTITIPANATVAFPIGSTLYYRSAGAGGVTLSAAGGVTLNGNTTISQHETIMVHKVATDEWDCHGGTAA